MIFRVNESFYDLSTPKYAGLYFLNVMNRNRKSFVNTLHLESVLNPSK